MENVDNIVKCKICKKNDVHKSLTRHVLGSGVKDIYVSIADTNENKGVRYC